jgi:hypothetical protein
LQNEKMIWNFTHWSLFGIWCLAFGAFPLSPEGEIVPDEKKSESGQKEKDDEEDLLAFNIGSQIDQEYPYSQRGMKGYHQEQKELQWAAVGQEEMESQKEENEDSGDPLEQPGPHTRQGLPPDLRLCNVPLKCPFPSVRHHLSPFLPVSRVQ